VGGAELGDHALGFVGPLGASSATGPDGFVSEQISGDLFRTLDDQ